MISYNKVLTRIVQFSIITSTTTQRNKNMTYQTLEQSLKTKSVVIISSESYDHKGEKRNWIKARKANGKKVFSVAQYGNGMFSEAT